MSIVVQNLGNFIIIAIGAMFVQNAVFVRGFGVSRLVKLVSDSAVDSIIFCAMLCFVQITSAPLAFLGNKLLMQTQWWFKEYMRPLVLVVCAIVALGLVVLFIALLRLPNAKEMLAVLPMATFNSAVLGPLLLSATQKFDFVQTMGFALGSGLGYGLAVLIVSEGQRKLSGRSVPSTFKGLPINLVYVGILALAMYGLIGHRLPT